MFSRISFSHIAALFLGLIASVAIIVGIGCCCLGLHLAGCALRVILVPPVDWALMGFLVASALTVVGFGLFSLFYVKKQWRIYRLKKRHPDEPWLWREDWAVGVAKCSTLRNMTLPWIGISFCWVLGCFFVYLYAGAGNCENLESDGCAVVQNRASQVWLVLGGDAPLAGGPRDVWVEPHRRGVLWSNWRVGWKLLGVGTALLVWPLLWTFRWVRFGRSVFEMEHVPGVIGGVLKGTIRPGKKLKPKDGCHLKLSCLGKLQEEQTIWQLSETDSQRSAIPVSFQIPSEGKETEPYLGVVWQLEATAKVPGVNYKATFEVPAFRTGDSPPLQPPEPIAASLLDSEAGWQLEEKDVGMRIQMNPTCAGGKEFFCAYARGDFVVLALSMLLSLTCFCAAALCHALLTQPPIWFVVPLALVTLLLFFILTVCCCNYRVCVEDEVVTVTVTSNLPGWSRTRMIPVSQIERIDAEVAFVGARGVSNTYNIYVKQRDGRKLTAVRDIPDQTFAKWLAAEMWRCVAEKAQSHEQAMASVLFEPEKV